MTEQTPEVGTSSSGAAPRRRRGWRWAVEIGLLAALFVGVRAWTHRGLAHGTPAPLEAVELDGRPVSLASLRGRPVLVHFWATWCGVCRLEQRSIDSLARDYTVITVASQSGPAAQVAQFVRQEGLGFPVVVDEDGALARAWGVSGFPSDFVIDASGSIQFVEVGYTTGLGLRARLKLAN